MGSDVAQSDFEQTDKLHDTAYRYSYLNLFPHLLTWHYNLKRNTYLDQLLPNGLPLTSCSSTQQQWSMNVYACQSKQNSDTTYPELWRLRRYWTAVAFM